MATEEDRSLGGGMSLPMWMRSRSRLHDRLDFDQSTFSPPENDDSFLYIRYPKVTPPPEKNDSVNKTTITVSDNKITQETGAVRKAVDVSRHTVPCKDYILGKTEPAQSQILSSNGKPKSAGTDDGFKGEAAACGTSVIRVASQMVSGKVVKGFDSFEEEEKEHMLAMGFDPKLRRGSRSLPASPLQSPNASPKSKRKLVNKYFTGAYADDKKPGSILANLLAKRDLSRSVTSISEEQTVQETAIKLQNFSLEDVEKKAAPKPKPSHLREMNFWSPTSM